MCKTVMKTLPLGIEFLGNDVITPSYNDEQDAAMDVYAWFPEGEKNYVDIGPGETVLIRLGFKLDIPHGYFIDVRPRSGISLKTNLRVANAPGTIDANYKDEVMVLLTNISTSDDSQYNLSVNCKPIVTYLDGTIHYIDEPEVNKKATYRIMKGDKIAQILPMERIEMLLSERSITDELGNRGGGFGSSGN